MADQPRPTRASSLGSARCTGTGPTSCSAGRLADIPQGSQWGQSMWARTSWSGRGCRPRELERPSGPQAHVLPAGESIQTEVALEHYENCCIQIRHRSRPVAVLICSATRGRRPTHAIPFQVIMCRCHAKTEECGQHKHRCPSIPGTRDRPSGEPQRNQESQGQRQENQR